MSGTLPSELGLLSGMLRDSFVLKSSAMSGTLPTELGLLTGLRLSLSIQDSMISGTLPSQLGLLTQLSAAFRVHGTRISGTLPSQLGMFTALQGDLRLHNNRLSGTLPRQLAALRPRSCVLTHAQCVSSAGGLFSADCGPSGSPFSCPVAPELADHACADRVGCVDAHERRAVHVECGGAEQL